MCDCQICESKQIQANFLAHEPCGAVADAVGSRAGLLCLRPLGAGATAATYAGVAAGVLLGVVGVSRMEVEAAADSSAPSGRGGKPLKSRR